jgi:hypothetical protein
MYVRTAGILFLGGFCQCAEEDGRKEGGGLIDCAMFWGSGMGWDGVDAPGRVGDRVR